MSLPRRALAALAAASLLPVFLTVQAAATASTARGGEAELLRPSDGRYKATITRTEHGIPHIVADDYGSLGFGNGFATAETSICLLADTVLTGRGERSRWYGPDGQYSDHVTLSASNLQTDTLFGDIRNREVVEKLLADPVAGPGEETKAMVRGYVSGINEYLRSIGGSDNITDPACKGEPWIKPDATALDLWYGVYAANLLASTGVFAKEIVEADPPSPDDPGLPQVPVSGFAPVPEEVPSREALMKGLGKDPEHPFGSNATAVGKDATTTGRGMVLGNPHFPWRGRYRFTQAHLTIPGEYDIAGAALIGSPVINIGWNRNVAWSHTVSTAYRFTPYEYRTVPGVPTTYVTDGGPKELEHRTVEVEVLGDDGKVTTVTEDLYRTEEGYVLDAPAVLMSWSPVSFFALRDANAEHLRTVDTFHLMAQADDVESLLAAQDAGSGMPWVNTIAADRSGDVLYADHSVVPNVPDDLVQQCATPIGHVLFQLAGLPALDGTRASSDCAWRTDEDATRPGIFGPANLPDTTREDWVINANDSYWLPNPEERLEGFARIIGCEECERSLRTRVVYRYVMDRLDGSDGLADGKRVSHRTLRLFEHENRVFAAELSREDDDLQDVCAAAEGGEACELLAAWDGRTDADSVGAHIFREFFTRVPADPWTVPFDPADPVGTPRDLDESNEDVVAAMRDALAYLEEEGVPLDAELGSLQVAADEGAPPIALGGGFGSLGNANALAIGDPATNQGRLYPISYGSSHIQAVRFTDRGVNADTILTYGQSLDPGSPFASDQTRLFGNEQWVDFPWTDRQIRRSAIGRYVVSARR